MRHGKRIWQERSSEMAIGWYINRLRAMSVPEVAWRLEQKAAQQAERNVFGKRRIAVTDRVFRREWEGLVFHRERLALAEQAAPVCSDAAPVRIALPGGYDYETYKKDWHAGFQTPQKWPQIFSGDLHYKQRDEIGDARTNWELNRHFQFAMLARRYCRTKDRTYLTELSELFFDWNAENPFLTGISWTSVMEAAIRDINWIYTLGFLSDAAQAEENAAAKERIGALCRALRVGIINMTEYIAVHYSRHSSANNHVITEAAAMGLAGLVMNCGAWFDTAFYILQYEIERQNYGDGVNKEVSLHYQSFFMEAVGLLMLHMQINGIRVPQMWRNTLVKMSRYLADCQGQYGESVVFGDDDGGKILDLQGAMQRNHYDYVLQLMSVVLPERYAAAVTDDTLLAIVPGHLRERMGEKRLCRRTGSVCYEQGGVSLLRSEDGSALIGIDHGELGLGSIAAHGHADALSFQMYLGGSAIFADAGTYIYHIDLQSRNAFRKTENHNTVTINGADQSEMRGAFLWGKRAETRLLAHNLAVGNARSGDETRRPASADGRAAGILYVEAEHNGYGPVIHRRKYRYDGKNCLQLYDDLLHAGRDTVYGVHFLLGQGCRVEETGADHFVLSCPCGANRRAAVTLQFRGEGGMCLSAEESWVSGAYGEKERVKKLRVTGKTDTDCRIITTIRWKEQNVI